MNALCNQQFFSFVHTFLSTHFSYLTRLFASFFIIFLWTTRNTRIKVIRQGVFSLHLYISQILCAFITYIRKPFSSGNLKQGSFSLLDISPDMVSDSSTISPNFLLRWLFNIKYLLNGNFSQIFSVLWLNFQTGLFLFKPEIV